MQDSLQQTQVHMHISRYLMNLAALQVRLVSNLKHYILFSLLCYVQVLVHSCVP